MTEQDYVERFIAEHLKLPNTLTEEQKITIKLMMKKQCYEVMGKLLAVMLDQAIKKKKEG